MNEQRRVFITMILCFGVFWIWQSVFPPPPTLESPQAITGATSQTNQSLAPQKIASKDDLSSFVGPRVPLVQQVIETSQLRGLLENDLGGLAQLDLKEYSERQKTDDETPRPISLVAQGLSQATVTWLSDVQDHPILDFSGTADGLLTGVMPSGLHYSMHVVPKEDSYSFGYTLKVENKTDRSHRVGATVNLSLMQDGETKKGWFSAEGDQLRALCKADKKISRQTLDQLEKKPFEGRAARWVAIDRQYFVIGLVADNLDDNASCSAQRDGQTLKIAYTFGEQDVLPGGVYVQHFTLYAGPKHSHRLSDMPSQIDTSGKQSASQFEQVIDYSFAMIPLGFLARPMVWLLGVLHHLTNSWGVAIILLTITVKIILFPVTYKSALSMRKMQEIKPELDRIRLLYKQDPEKQQAAQLKAYKDNGVNPAGGCLPMLLQIPVWATLYRTLWSCVDLYQQPFLWLQDLTLKEPFPFLALAVGAVTVLQQRLMPQAADNEQMRIMMIVMPIVLTGFMVALPSGLVLYVLVNSVLTIIQQLAINRRTRPA